MKELEVIAGVDRLLTVEEVAACLGVQTNTVHNWSMAKNRKLPLVKIGRLNRYRLADLNAFIGRNMRQAVDANAPQVSI